MSPYGIARPYLDRYRARLAVLAALMASATLFEGVGIGLFFPLLDYVQQGAAVASRPAWKPVLAVLARLGLQPSAGLLICAIFAAIVTTLALKCAATIAGSRVSNPLMKDVRDDAFSRLLGAHLFHFHAGTSGRVVQTIDEEVENVGQTLNFSLVIVQSALTLLIYGLVILFVSWRLTLLVAAVAALRYGVSGLFIRTTRRLAEENARLRGRVKTSLITSYQGIDVIKTFATEQQEQEAFQLLTSRVSENTHALTRNAATGAFFEGLLGDGALCVIVYVGVSMFQVSGAALLTFLVAISRMIPKVTSLNDARIRIAEFRSRTAELERLLTPGSLPALAWGSRRKESFESAVAFERVTFSYPGAAAPALKDVALTLKRHEVVAVVGASGSGKSTLARLLLRLFDPASGAVTVDGVPLPELRREDWTRLVGVVSQDTFIFDDTLERNVKLAAPRCSEAEFREALRRARVEDFVASLPRGKETRLGERGVALSGGQRQRVAIARAFLRNAPILILDEATSALDAETERLIQESLQDLSRDRTMLVIAHRLATIKNADRIVVLEAGRVAESGTRQELLDQDRLYRRFHDLQLF